MSSHENDISWQTLRQLVREWFGTAADLAEVRPLEGGCINCTLCLTLTDGSKSVLKVSPHRVTKVFADEAYHLETLRRAGVPVPHVYATAVGSLDHPFSYVLMEFVEGVNLADARRTCTTSEYDELQRHLAGLLKDLHHTTSDHYGRLAACGQRSYERWPDFFRDIYADIWHEVEKSQLLPIKVRKQIGRVHERLPALLAHNDCPRLLHWDLWCGNVLARPTPGDGWRVVALLDPNCKYGHAEAEIAYVELFGTGRHAFMQAYQQDKRFPTEYHTTRKHIYQLYQMLNHVRLFGHEYVKPTIGIVEKLNAVV
jgi:fructosamine-3-kinase